jgi:pyruvate dehydrogenase E2 component (dihydrolipoamide acetyltransferase)
MAVALEEGLIVPVIKHADTLPLKHISQCAAKLAAKAREGTLVPDDYSAGTFTVSNLGMHGITSFTPLINPPESAILGVCTIEEELHLFNGKVESRQIMGLSLTIDHRVIDGAQGALFLQKITTLLEHPLELVIS